MNFFNFNFKKAFILLLIALLPLISINMEQKKTSNYWFNQPISYLSGLTQSSFSGISEFVRGTTAEYINILKIKKINKVLKIENDELKARLNLFNESSIEIDRLKKLLEFKSNTKMNLVAAQVIGHDLSMDHETLTINKGLNDGLKGQQAVITTQGAVGYIFKPKEKTSLVLLVSDRYSVSDALIQKTRSHALLEGLGNNLAVLQFVDRDENIQLGDLIVTGSLDKIYPQGLPLGTVHEILRQPNSSQRILHIKPVVEAEKVEEVFIILSIENEDFLPENTQTQQQNQDVKKNE